MTSLDVEALLEEPFKAEEKNGDGDGNRSENGSMSSRHKRRRSRSRDSDRHRSKRHDDERRSDNHSSGGRDRDIRGGDRERGSERGPGGDRDREREERYNSRRRERDREVDEYYGRGNNARRRSRSPRRRSRTRSPQLTEDERDRRTVFVQQLAARLRTKELIAFFEKVGPVKEAQIVKDRVSGRSKGVGYVEFRQEESVAKAIQLTGQKLLGIPIIAQLTEAEKNRQARVEGQHGHKGDGDNRHSIPFHRLYVGNIHFSITETDLQHVFEPFGELEFVQLQKEEGGRSRGYGFVQYRDPTQAKDALEKMNGFDLAGRPIRVGLGNDKFTPESTAQMLQRFNGGFREAQNQQQQQYEPRGGRGAANDRDQKQSGSHASALDDTDVAGVNFNNFSRDALMRKLARQEEPATAENGDSGKGKPQHARAAPAPAKPLVPLSSTTQASRCVILKNMFDPNEESGDTWQKELEEDVKAECEDKYGKVMHISLDPNSPGEIYLKFEKVTGGEKAIQGLNGRFFGGRQVSALPVVDAVYSSLFSRTKAM